MIYLAAVLIAAGYVLGSIPVGVLIVKARHGFDIREVGSGNLGTANVFRSTGPQTALVVLVADVAKGAVPTLIAALLGLGTPVVAGAGLAAVLGHSYPLFLKFRGGKSVATTAGVLLALDPLSLLLGIGCYVVIVVLARYASVASMGSALCTVFILWWRPLPLEYFIFGIVAFLFIVYRHHSNIKRLLAGRETRLSLFRRKGDA